METSASVAISVAALVATYLPFFLAGSQSKEEREKARERRMAEHRMNARLLRFDI